MKAAAMPASNAPPLPPEVIAAFAEAAQTALRELTQFESNAGELQSGSAAECPAGAVTATMRLQRSTPGTMTLQMPLATAEQLAARYLPAGTELTAELIDDVAGEFANVIAGQAKTMLKGTPFHYTLSTPVVARVQDSAGPAAEVAAVPVIVVECAVGRCLLRVDLSPGP